MGYSGVKTWIESDTAADLFANVETKIIKMLSKALKGQDNGWANTTKYFEVGMFIVAHFGKVHTDDISCPAELITLVDDTHSKLSDICTEIRESDKDEWDPGAKAEHIQGYSNLLKRLTKLADRLYYA